MFEVTTVDAHVAGGAVRLITAGFRTSTPLRSENVSSCSPSAPARPGGAGAGTAGSQRRGRRRARRSRILQTPMRHCCFIDPRDPLQPCGHALIGATGLAITRGVLTPRAHGTVRYDTTVGRMTATTVGAARPWCGPGALHGSANDGAAVQRADQHRPARSARRSRLERNRARRHRRCRDRRACRWSRRERSSCSVQASTSFAIWTNPSG